MPLIMVYFSMVVFEGGGGIRYLTTELGYNGQDPFVVSRMPALLMNIEYHFGGNSFFDNRV